MSKGKKKVAFRWGSEWMILWIFGGFLLAYFIYIPITGDKVHPEHWLFALLGGVFGYGIGLFFDTCLPPIVRFVRHISKKMTLKQDRGKQTQRRR